MAQCPNCGAKVSDAVVMCTQCGTNIKTGEKFATKVRKGGKGKKKGDSKAPSMGVFMAVLILFGGLAAYNYQQKKRLEKLNEARHSILGPLAEADKLLKADKPEKALAKLDAANNELQARKELYKNDKEFLSELTQIEERIAAERKKIEARIDEKRAEAARRAKEEEMRKKMIAAGYEMWQGRWLKPAQIRRLGYRKIHGQWVSIRELQRCGWTYLDGDFRSPEEVYDRGYRMFEGRWRPIDYVRQAKGDVKGKDGQWMTQQEALKRAWAKVTIKNRKEPMIARVEKDAKGGMVIYLAKGGRIRYTKQMVDFFKPKIESLAPLYRSVLRRMQTERSPDKLLAMAKDWLEKDELKWWPNAKWQAQRCRDLAELRRRGRPVGTPADAARALAAPRPRSPKPRPVGQPAAPARRVAGTSASSLVEITAAQTDAVVGKEKRKVATLKKGQRVPCLGESRTYYKVRVRAAGGPRIAYVSKKAARIVSAPAARRPAAMIEITAAQTDAVVGKEKRKVATLKKGQRVPCLGESRYYYKVSVRTAQGLRTAYVSKKAARRISGKPAASAPKWVTVQTSSASVQAHRNGKWVVVATLKKGARAPVVRVGKTHYLVQVTVNGKKVQGWLSKKAAR